MKHRICSLFLIIVTLTAFALSALAATVEKRAPLAPPPTTTSPPTGSTAPSVKGQPERGPKSGTIGPLDRLGPTENLSLVANRMRLKSKSLTTLITVAPNLPVTQPVEISIGYYSPAGTQRITQSYVRATGNRFLYNDNEGDGKPRRMRIDVSLREPKLEGGFYTFSFPMEVTLDPLYDVTISPLKFDLISNCDTVGESEIQIKWRSPEAKIQYYTFSTPAGKRITYGLSAWARAEVSASHNLFKEEFLGFRDLDDIPGPHGFSSETPIGDTPRLVPGKTQTVKGNKKAENGSCEVYYEYTIKYQLRWYPYL